MFNAEFFPTPLDVIEMMLDGEVVKDKVVLEPEAGKGDIVDYLLNHQARDILAVELNADLRAILATKCRVIGSDFLTIESHQISHIDLIVMNPPFSAGDTHVLHAYNIAPPGSRIVALLNSRTIKNDYSRTRKELSAIIETYGTVIDIDQCFGAAERKTDASIALVRITKPGGGYQAEFEGFFMDEEQEAQSNGIMSYNFIRDLVNRYAGAVKIYDQQLDAAIKMNALTAGFYGSSLSMTMTEEGKPKARNEYKKGLQKAAWKFIFEKMNMQKYATRSLKEDINKFVENQTNIPFTMKNIYRMLEIVIGTQGERMDKALLEVFDKLTQHYSDNRYFVEGWKTNSHFMLTQKFILPYMVEESWSKDGKMKYQYGGNAELIEDMVKALCALIGMNYDETTPLSSFISNMDPEFGKWYCWGFFEIKGFKKGTMHFKFQTLDLWAKFNQHISRLKGYPLFEGMEQTAYQDRQTGRAKRA